MRKFLLTVFVLMVSASVGSSLVSAQDVAPQQDSAKTYINIDSVKAKSHRFGERVAEVTTVLIDSASVKGSRFANKSLEVGDTLIRRSKKAWKVMRGE